jgi:hypothetical protein
MYCAVLFSKDLYCVDLRALISTYAKVSDQGGTKRILLHCVYDLLRLNAELCSLSLFIRLHEEKIHF